MSIGFAIGLLFRLDKHRWTLVSYFYLWYKAKQRFRAEEFQIPPHRQALSLCAMQKITAIFKYSGLNLKLFLWNHFYLSPLLFWQISFIASFFCCLIICKTHFSLTLARIFETVLCFPIVLYFDKILFFTTIFYSLILYKTVK